ncbi:c-type cytochrome, methanol metabolism-related [Tabrizicola sp.]|uniref:c-type cytochrome, methanol metabolism-related n=1 Tax=Tabrizicola sp. TaxID=2005166 RepID=UPI0025EC3EA6|nr:c-type cytochrome, methanol metabolism-related [Tabrizicola sp.]
MKDNRNMPKTNLFSAIGVIALVALPLQAQETDPNLVADHEENGRWMTAEGIPTYKIEEDGTVDWATFSGFRRYHAECHVCHGPDGEGSTYAPALKRSAVVMDYYDFYTVVAEGRQKVGGGQNSVMPSFGTNPNVMCYLDDIYTYLKARGTDAVPRGRPAKRAEKSEEVAANEESCMDS